MSDTDNADITSANVAETPVENTAVETTSTEESGQQQPQDGQQVEKPAEEEKIVLTQKEYDARAAAIRNMAERRAMRKAEEKFKAQQPQTAQQQPVQNIGTPQSPNDLWDDNLKTFIPRDLTIEQYAQLAQSVQAQQPAQQPVAQQQGTVNPPQSENGLTEDAETQAVTLAAKVGQEKIQAALRQAPISDVMVNAVAVDPNGMENLYNAILERPHEIYQICQLSPMEQQAKMWEMNQECAKKRAPKVQTSATPQPAPLKEGGNFVKPYAEMSYEEKKAAKRRELDKR